MEVFLDGLEFGSGHGYVSRLWPVCVLPTSRQLRLDGPELGDWLASRAVRALESSPGLIMMMDRATDTSIQMPLAAYQHLMVEAPRLGAVTSKPSSLRRRVEPVPPPEGTVLPPSSVATRLRAVVRYCQVDEKLADRPPRYCARARREPAMLGIRNGCQPQLDSTGPVIRQGKRGGGDDRGRSQRAPPSEFHHF